MNPMIRSLDEAKALYVASKVAYEVGKPIMSDARFDKLEDAIRRKDPKWKELRKTGVTPQSGKKTKVHLPMYMPSLPKFYPDAVEKKVKPKKRYTMSNKLDGSSLLLKILGGRVVTAITRGDGEFGQDVSFLIPQFGLPSNISDKGAYYLRCEAVMKSKTFDKKYSADNDNPRNLVAGILNRKSDGTLDPMLRDVDVVVLGVFGQTIETGLKMAAKWGFETVTYSKLESPDADTLVELLNHRRAKSEYEMDGLVLSADDWVMAYLTNDKPKDIWAFKVNSDDETFTADVVKIVYQVTGHGRIIPKVELKPVRMGGVTVTFATVHNAQWMLDRKIGPGAKIKIVRSGGVIPKIVDVVKAGKTQLPEIGHKMLGKHFVVADATDETKDRITVLRIHKWMTTMGIELVGTKTVAQALSHLPTVESWLDAKWNRALGNVLSERVGLGDKTASNIEKEFYRVLGGETGGTKIPMRRLMVASSCYPPGIGDRKLQQLEQHGVSMASLVALAEAGHYTRLQQLVAGIHGFEEVTASAVANGTKKFLHHLKVYRKYLVIDGGLPKIKKVVSGKLSGERISWTGYRSADEEAAVEAAGGKVVSFGSRTTILLYKDGGKASSKLIKASSNGIKVKQFKELKL